MVLALRSSRPPHHQQQQQVGTTLAFKLKKRWSKQLVGGGVRGGHSWHNYL